MILQGLSGLGGLLTALAWGTREMILVVLEIITFKGHQAEDCGLFGFIGDFVCIEGLRGEFSCCLCCSTFSLVSLSS